jgi:hypothetical protein
MIRSFSNRENISYERSPRLVCSTTNGISVCARNAVQLKARLFDWCRTMHAARNQLCLKAGLNMMSKLWRMKTAADVLLLTLLHTRQQSEKAATDK